LIDNKIKVCLNELLLKHYIVNQLPIKNIDNAYQYLPCISDFKSLIGYSYMYKNIFMYIDDNFILRFYNLENPKEKQKRNDFLQNLGIDWFHIENEFAIRNNTREYGKDKINQYGNQTENGIKNTHFVFSQNLALAIEDTEERVLFKTEATKKAKSQRIIESKTALESVYFSEDGQIYTVGEKSMGQTMDKSVKVRKLRYYQTYKSFKIDELLQTLCVQFVRNQQYTIYPYFFDLLNLYRTDILQQE
jgi:hypothetical protein